MRPLCLLLLFAPLVALADDRAFANEDAPREYTLIPPRNILVPIVEVPAFHLSLVAFNRLVIGDEFTKVTPSSAWNNLTAEWTLDTDSLWVNYLGHSYQGSLYFNAARSSGLTFWESSGFALAGGWLWEIAGENAPPSINDLMSTGIGGTLLGETFHRMSQLLLDGPHSPHPLQVVGAFFVDPLGSFNRAVFGERRLRSTLPPRPRPRTEGYFLLGGSWITSSARPELPNTTRTGTPVQAGAGLELTSSFPGDEKVHGWRPLEHFDLRGDFAVPGSPMANVTVRGLILGQGFGETEGLGGAWGLFGTFDFVSGPAFRVADTGLGPGTALQVRLGSRGWLRTSALVAGIPVGGVGTHEESGTDVTPEGTPIPYFAGPGVHALIEAELAHADIGALRVSARGWWLSTVRGDVLAWDESSTLTLAGRVKLVGRHHLGADATWSLRDAGVQSPLEQEGWVVRLFWVLPFADALPLR